MNNEFQNKVDFILKTNADKIAITHMRDDGADEQYTFGEIREFIIQINDLLDEVGLSKGDRVAIITPHSPYGVIAGLILAYLNITIIPIDVSLPVKEINKLLIFLDIRAMFTTVALKDMLDKELINRIPCFQLGGAHNPIALFNDSVSKLTLPPTVDRETDVIAIIFSSGTTDQMKGIKVTYQSVLKAQEVFVRLSSLETYMTYLLVLPFNHIAGFTGAMTFFLTGCRIGFIEDVNASKLVKGLQSFEPYYFAMVPKVLEVIEQKIWAKFQEKGKLVERIFNILLKLSGFIRKTFGLNIGRKMFKGITSQVFGANIFGIGTGSSPCKKSTAEFYLNLGLEWANLYATTETSVPIVSTGVHDRYSADSLGNIHAHPEIKIKIGNQDENGVGEILVKSELMMKGYFRQPELTKLAFEGEYFKTGDYGFVDQKGNLHITGRIKESIVLRTGKKVSPIDVDEYYGSRLTNIELACRGVISEEGTYDEIHLFIEDKKYSISERQSILRELKNISRQAPSMYKLDGIHYISQIPKTTVGKVKRFCLNVEENINIEYEKEIKKEDYLVGQIPMEEVLDIIINKVTANDGTRKYATTESLSQDIGMDSLDIFEMCVALQEWTNVSIEKYLYDGITVGDILNLLEKQNRTGKKTEDITKQSLKNSIEKSVGTEKYSYYQRAVTSDKFFKKLKKYNMFLKWYFHPIILHKENLVENSNIGVMYVSNHRSTLDPLVISVVLSKHIHWVALLRFFRAEDSVFNNSKNVFLCWLTAYIFHRLDLIPIERKSDNPNANNMKAIGDMIGFLGIGERVGIFPEGTTKRPENKDFGDFDSSFLTIAHNSNAYIQPITILWTENQRGKKLVALNFRPAFRVEEKSSEVYMEYFLKEQMEGMKELKEYTER